MSVHTQQPKSAATLLSIRALAEPGTLIRVLEHFAKRGVSPASVHARTVGADNAVLHIDLQIEALERHLVELIAENMRQMPAVERVLLGDCSIAAVA